MGLKGSLAPIAVGGKTDEVLYVVRAKSWRLRRQRGITDERKSGLGTG